MSNTPRHLLDREPKYALVVWGWDGESDDIRVGQMGCLAFVDIEPAEANGAMLLMREDADFCKPRQPQRVDHYVIHWMKNHPYRHDAAEDEEYR